MFGLFFFQRQVETVILPALDRCFGELLAQIRQMFLTGTMDYLKETKTMSSAMIEGVTKQLPDPKMFQAQMQQTQIQNEEAKVRQADLIAAVRYVERSISFRTSRIVVLTNVFFFQANCQFRAFRILPSAYGFHHQHSAAAQPRHGFRHPKRLSPLHPSQPQSSGSNNGPGGED